MCGIFGVLSTIEAADKDSRVAQLVLCGLHALQHRGQDAAGVATLSRSTGNCNFHHGEGLVATAFFDHRVTERLLGSVGVGHVRYPTRGGPQPSATQPFVLHTKHGQMALCHNGELTNSEDLRKDLMRSVGFRSTSDTEVLAQFLAGGDDEQTPEERILSLMHSTTAAYSVVLATSAYLIAFADPLGMRPLCLGRDSAAETFFAASESCAISACGGTVLRDVLPGEVVRINWDGTQRSVRFQLPPPPPPHPAAHMHALAPQLQQQRRQKPQEAQAKSSASQLPEDSAPLEADEPEETPLPQRDPRGSSAAVLRAQRYVPAPCIFEFVYFSRPDSVVWGQQVHEVRVRIGAALAAEHPPAAGMDVVAGVPDSGTPVALGYAQAAGVRYDFAFARNRYVGRSFIKPDKTSRDLAVRLKFQPIRSVVAGKKVLIVDDTVVRGTTLPHLVQLLKEAGAVEVHVRVAAPPVIFECNMGIDLKKRNEMILNRMTQEELRRFVGATSLEFLSLQALGKVCGPGHCTACFSGSYPTKNLTVVDIEDIK
eukprot:m.200826 g.200826  ORF g.200826 m.200826 type:complete len:540 (+) comp21923_c2_seq2:1100-2719(+)